KRKGSRVERHVGLVAQVPVPDDLAGLLVGRDDATVMAGHGDDEIPPQRNAAVAVDLFLARIHLPQDAAHGARTQIDLVDHAPGIDHVHKAVVDQRRRQEIFVRRGAAQRHGEGELEISDVRLVDRVERREVLRAVVAMVHEPVVRFGIAQAFEGDVGRARVRRHGQQRASNRGRSRDGFDLHANYSPNTNSTVAFDNVFISGERASLARPTTPMPEAMAMYCLPSTMYVMGGATKPEPTLIFHNSSSVWSS